MEDHRTEKYTRSFRLKKNYLIHACIVKETKIFNRYSQVRLSSSWKNVALEAYKVQITHELNY